MYFRDKQGCDRTGERGQNFDRENQIKFLIKALRGDSSKYLFSLERSNQQVAKIYACQRQ